MKKLLTITLALSLLCATFLFVPASATEEDEIIDWNTVDWENFDFSYLWNGEFASQRLESWNHWMLNEASLERLVEVAKGRPDASFATDYAFALGRRFVQEPFGMLTAMTQCDSDTQDDVAGYLALSEAYAADNVDIVKFLTDLQLPEGASAERAMLNKIIDYVEQYYGVEIPRNETPEIIDWNTVDWENINFDHLNDDMRYSLQNWLKNEASAEGLIRAVKAKWDGAYVVMYENALGSQFIEEPIAMLSAMQHDVRNKDKVVGHLARSEAYGENNVDIVEFLTKLQLPSIDAKEWAVLYEIILYVEDYLGVDIQHPEFSKIVDWNTVDWETFNLSAYCDVRDIGWIRFENWCAWLENEATLEQVVEAVKTRMGSYMKSSYEGVLQKRFAQEPLATLTAMSQADEAYHDRFIQYLTPYYEDEVDLIKALAEVKLPADATAEREILNKIIDRAKQLNGVDIPRTGDPIALALAALLLSSTGLATLAIRKKRAQ